MATTQQKKYLKELLKEEQEPFHFHPNPSSDWTFPSTLCSSSCFSSSSPHYAFRTTPLFLRLPLPPKTAAFRVHKHPPSDTSKTRFRNSGFGLRIGSLIKRLTNRTPTRKRQTENRSIGDGDLCFNHSPALSSPAMSPSQSQPISQEQEVEEDKEHKNSPVSILDPPFELDDEYQNGKEDEYREDVDGFDLECSYAFLQRAKDRLLLTLQKFEELAELDPTKLEETIGEEEKEDGDEYEHDLESEASDNVDCFLADESGLIKDLTKPWMKRLVVSNRIREEERLKCSSSSGDDEYDKLLSRRVCDQLDSWPEKESNTIEMMVDIDIRGERVKWTKQEQDYEICRAVNEIEFTVFQVLVEELLDEFVIHPNQL